MTYSSLEREQFAEEQLNKFQTTLDKYFSWKYMKILINFSLLYSLLYLLLHLFVFDDLQVKQLIEFLTAICKFILVCFISAGLRGKILNYLNNFSSKTLTGKSFFFAWLDDNSWVLTFNLLVLLNVILTISFTLFLIFYSVSYLIPTSLYYLFILIKSLLTLNFERYMYSITKILCNLLILSIGIRVSEIPTITTKIVLIFLFRKMEEQKSEFTKIFYKQFLPIMKSYNIRSFSSSQKILISNTLKAISGYYKMIAMPLEEKEVFNKHLPKLKDILIFEKYEEILDYLPNLDKTIRNKNTQYNTHRKLLNAIIKDKDQLNLFQYSIKLDEVAPSNSNSITNRILGFLDEIFVRMTPLLRMITALISLTTLVITIYYKL